MGGISSSIGLISGIDTASLIEQLLLIEAQPKIPLERRLATLQTQQTALLDVNARLLGLQSSSRALRIGDVFRATNATSSNEERLLVSTGASAQPGQFKFVVKQLVSTSQKLSKGFADANTTPLGLSSLGFEFGQARLTKDRALEDLNAGAGVKRGTISITDRSGTTASVDLTDVTTLNEVIDRINDNSAINVTASLSGDGIVLTDGTGQTASDLIVADVGTSTTATDLGIAKSVSSDTLTGDAINTIGGSTALATLNDGNGVLIVDNNPDFTITDSLGNAVDIDLGRVDLPIEDETALSELNNGEGITITNGAPDFIISVDGNDVEINLGDVLDDDDLVLDEAVTTVGELRSRINDALDDAGYGEVSIEIDASGDSFNIVDTSGRDLQIKGAGSNGIDTAEDLGIDADGEVVTGGTISGDRVPALVDRARASTLQEVVDRINEQAAEAATAVDITAAISADGLRLELTEGSGGTIIVESSSLNEFAARQLGIETTSAGVTGGTLSGARLIAGLGSVLSRSIQGGDGATGLRATTTLDELFGGTAPTTSGDASAEFQINARDGSTYDIDLDAVTTLQDLIEAVETASGGDVTLGLTRDRLQFNYNGSGAGTFSLTDVTGTFADDFGLTTGVTGNTLVSENGGGATQFEIQDRDGDAVTIDIDGLENVSDIISLINSEAAANNVDITVGLNNSRNGLQITDTSGGTGNLIITGSVAENLGINTGSGGIAEDDLRGENLQLQYVSVATKLSDLNFGRGVGTGSFTITDGLGDSATVSIGSDATTLYDVILEINSRGLAVEAAVNDNGDGIVLRQDDARLNGQEPFIPISVSSAGGSAAADLRILGESSTVENAAIDGSYEVQVDLETSDNLNEVVSKINSAGVPVSASVVNTGAGGSPFRLNLSSEISGLDGELVIDTGSVDLGLTTISEGRDAKVFFGSENPEDAFLLSSSTNSLNSVLNDVTIDLLQAGDEAVTITITRDTGAVVGDVQGWVNAFNDVLSQIDEYDFFDIETEQRGVLLGDPTLLGTRNGLFQTLLRPATGIGSQFTRLSQVGIRVGDGARVTFDEERFREALETDREGVVNLFTAFEQESIQDETIAPGITVSNTSQTTTSAGVARIFEEFLETLVNTTNGAYERADQRFNDQIELTNDRIETIDQRIEAERTRLERQFLAMELALARLQDQGNALGGISIPQISLGASG